MKIYSNLKLHQIYKVVTDAPIGDLWLSYTFFFYIEPLIDLNQFSNHSKNSFLIFCGH